jgi:hypothetical protein
MRCDRHVRLGTVVGTARTAKALLGANVSDEVIVASRAKVRANIRRRAVFVGAARRALGQELARRHGLALKHRLDERQRERLQSLVE